MEWFEMVACLFSAFYVLLILFYMRGWKRLKTFSPPEQKTSTTVSVIIAARKEAENITNLLNDLSKQTLSVSQVEIVVVDDHSDDNTFEVASKSNLPNLSVLKLNWVEGKKAAIAHGITNSKNALIVTTDADCRVPSNWLKTIVAYYEEFQPKLIAGAVVFEKGNGLLSKFQMLDFVSLMGITASCIQQDFPNMANGANLAYERAAYNKVLGFEGVDHIPTGDDILLALKVNQQYPGQAHFLKSKEAIVTTPTQTSWGAFASQRIRWISKAGKFQDNRITWVLVLAYFFNALILAYSLGGLVGNTQLLKTGLAMLVVKLFLDFIFVLPVASFFQRKSVLWLFLPIEILHLFYVVTMGLLANVLTYKWKGRTYGKK